MVRYILTAAFDGTITEVFEYYSQTAAEAHGRNLATVYNYDLKADDIRIWATDPHGGAMCVEVWNYDPENEVPDAED